MLAVAQLELIESLRTTLERFNAEGFLLALYRNDVYPSYSSSATDFLPATFGGYSGPVVLDLWDAVGVEWVQPRAVGLHPEVTFTADGTVAGLVYGYYVVDALGELRFAERDPSAPISMSSSGQLYRVNPHYTRRSEA